MSIQQIYDQIKTKYSITDNLFSITTVSKIELNAGSSPPDITKVLKVDKNNDITSVNFDANDSTHIIPFLNHGDIISDKESINISFAKYQYFNNLYNNPETIDSPVDIDIKEYFDYTSYYKFSDSYNKHTNMINNTVKNKSDFMEYLYVLKELSLIELYIKLLGIGLDAENKNANFGYDKITTCIENNHFNNLNNSMTFHLLKTTYSSEDNKLTVNKQFENNKSIYFFDKLDPEYHIIYEPQENKYYKIPVIIDLTENGKTNSYDLPDRLSRELENNKEYIIQYKTDVHAQNEYISKKKQLKEKNKLLLENKDELEKEKSNNNQIYSNYDQINIIYYLTYVIVFIVIIGMLSTNSEKSRIVRSLLLLMIVIVIYLILLSYINLKEYYNKELFTASNTDIADNLIEKSLNNILMNSPIIGKINLYNEFSNIMDKDSNKLDRNNLILDSNINRTIQNTSTGWHEKYQKSLFIHTVFLLMIVILLYLWLMSIMPELNIYLFIVTIIACMVLIFYYFTSLHRVVRSTYKQKYWTKMEINK